MGISALFASFRKADAPIDYFETLRRLKDIYATKGIELTVGVNSYLCSNLRSAPFALYHQNDALMTPHSGIAYGELLLIAQIAKTVAARRLFIIGNGFGWSTIGLAFLCPAAKVVALEPDAGIELTNDIAQERNLDAVVIPGRSPEDNRAAIQHHLGGVPDLILINAIHEQGAMSADFASVFEICGPDTIYIFHDILTFGLGEALRRLHQEFAAKETVLWIAAETSSGLGIIAPNALRNKLSPLISLFTPSSSALDTLRRVGKERALPVMDLLRS
jgi:predicted O-methyltransferase YrrM